MCVEMKHPKGSEAPRSAFPAQPGNGPPRETARLTQRYAAAVESAMDGYAVLGPERQFLEVNTALCALCGYSRDELLRLAIPDVEAAETESEIAAHAASVAASGRERFESRWRRKDGSVIDVEVAVTYHPQGGEFFLFVHDITEHKRLENEVRENEALLRGMFEQNVSAMFVIENGAFTYANRRAGEVLGRGSRALPGRPILELVATADRPGVTRVMQALLSGQIKTTNCDFSAVREDGAFVDVGAGMTRAMLRGKTVILGVAQDIGERKKAQEKIDHYVERLERTVWSTLEVISRMVDLRDPYTAGHERRVSALAKAIGAELGLGEERCRGLEAMGLIHDVGKIAAPSEVLSRPGKLTAAEFELVKLHAQFGYEIMKNAEFPWPVAESILQHHERLDGSGYPRGLKGEEILLEARIIAVADVVEAMSSHRPYRAALGIEKALAELVEHRGTRYDAAAVDACVKLFREGYSFG